MLKARIVNIICSVLFIGMVVYDWYNNLSLWWYTALIIGFLTIHFYGSYFLAAQFFLPVRFRGDRQSKKIAITFDDGPIPLMTERILDILQVHKTPAAFFCIGNRVDDQPALTKRIHDAGHLIGNHSYWHGAMFDLQSANKILKELIDTDTAIQKVIGKKPNFFRPPYGVTNPMVASAIKRGGYKTIGWSVRSFDTMAKDSGALLERVTKSLQGGDVILFHDYCTITAEILPAFLAHAAKVGLKIVRVDELLKEKAYV